MAEGELLLEVRAEEIPARMLAPASRDLATRLFEQLVALGLTPREVEAGFTPRRLWVVLTGLPVRESLALGALMNTRGLMELVVLNVGLDLKIISPTLFAMMVLMALVTTTFTTPVLYVLGLASWRSAPKVEPARRAL